MKKKEAFWSTNTISITIRWGGLWQQEENVKELLTSLLVISKLPTLFQISGSSDSMQQAEILLDVLWTCF